MDENVVEINFDSIVGLTHIYAGLSYGNIASEIHGGAPSNPKEAALQGLEKMWFIANTLGIPQGVLPPHQRPHLPTLRSLGFSGSVSEILQKAYNYSPKLLFLCCSASSMWAANAATVTPSSDTADGKVHFTAANLVSKLHRAIEAADTAALLQAIFSDKKFFLHHPPLPFGDHFADEGAANHSRLCKSHSEQGLHFFVYGRSALSPLTDKPQRYPARQTLEAQQAIARLHGIANGRAFYLQQSSEAIDLGAFHNDVAAVANEHVLLYHEKAYRNPKMALEELSSLMEQQLETPLHFIEVPEKQIPFTEAVRSYLFNSQLITTPSGQMELVAPIESYESVVVREWLMELEQKKDSPIKKIHFVDVRHSMNNGGGPACLRLRIPLKQKEIAALTGRVLLDEALYLELKNWICRHYRDRLILEDFQDSSLFYEGCTALDELYKILGLPTGIGVRPGM